jgi:hypothetical protein
MRDTILAATGTNQATERNAEAPDDGPRDPPGIIRLDDEDEIDEGDDDVEDAIGFIRAEIPIRFSKLCTSLPTFFH